MSLPVENITPGFLEALSVNLNFQSGEREMNWGTYAARYLFEKVLDIGLPKDIPNEQEFAALIVITDKEDFMRLAKNEGGVDKVYERANEYIQRAFGVELDANEQKKQAPESLKSILSNNENYELGYGPPPVDPKDIPKLKPLPDYDFSDELKATEAYEDYDEPPIDIVLKNRDLLHQDPTNSPYQSPSDEPTDNPYQDPSDEPTDNPYQDPSNEPTDNPYQDPSDDPSDNPNGPFEE